jgi:hypothetical protein
MRIALLSAVHGHCLALQTELTALRAGPYQELVCLGDMIQSGPQPAETAADLREVGCPVEMGNIGCGLMSDWVQNIVGTAAWPGGGG